MSNYVFLIWPESLLMAQHILSPSGRTLWSSASVREILTNPVYTGILYAGRTNPRPSNKRNSALNPVGRKDRGRVNTPPEQWVVGQIEAIVNKEQFEDWTGIFSNSLPSN